MRKLKCYGFCGEKYTKEEMKQISNKNYCVDCYEKVTQDRKDREELYKVISALYSIPYPTTAMLKQIKDYVEIRNYKIKGITLTLRYCKDQLKMDFYPKFGLGIVGYHYDAARNFWVEQQKRRASHKDVRIEIQKIEIPKFSLENEYKKNNIINLEGLL